MAGERVDEVNGTLNTIRENIGQGLYRAYLGMVTIVRNPAGAEPAGAGISRRTFLKGGLALAGLTAAEAYGMTSGQATALANEAGQGTAGTITPGSFSLQQACRARVAEIASTAFNDKGGERGWNRGDEVVGIPVGRDFTINIGDSSFRARINDRGVGEMIRDNGMPDPNTRSFEADAPVSQTATQRAGESAVDVSIRDGENGDITVHYVKCSSPAKLWQMVRTDRMRPDALNRVKKDPNAPVPPENIRPTRRIPGSERQPQAGFINSVRMAMFR